MCRAISPGSQSKDSEHIFSSLESGPAGSPIGRRGIYVRRGRDPSFFPVPLPPLFLSLRRFFALAVLLSISSTCSPRSPEIKARRHQQPGPWGVIRDEGWEPAVTGRVRREGPDRAPRERWPYNIH